MIKIPKKFLEKSSLKKSNSSEIVLIKEKSLLEFYISAFFSLLPISQDNQEICLMKLQENDIFSKFRLNSGIGIYLTNCSFEPFAKKLTPILIKEILQNILLERQIIFFSSKPEEISLITEIFLTLITPL